MKASERLAERARIVREFQEKFDALVGLMEEKPNGLVATKMVAKRGKREEVERLTREVSELAGRAQIAAKGHEQKIGVDIPHRGRTVLPAIQGWEYALHQPWLVEPAYLSGCIAQAVGRLTEEAAAARVRERSLTGRVAAFVGFPASVRAAVAAEHPSLGKAAFATGVFGQIVVTVVGGLILAGATAGVAALWKNVVQSSPAPASSPTVAPSTVAPATETPTAPTVTTVPGPTSK